MIETHVAAILSQMLDAWTEGVVEDVDAFIESYRDEIMLAVEIITN